MAEAYIVEAVRTPVGRRRGGLSGVHPADLGAHVLKALLDDEQGMAAGLIQAAGGDPLAARREVDALVAKIPSVTGSGATSAPALDGDTIRLLDQAEQVAQKAGDSFVTVERMLLAFALAKGTGVGDALARAGVQPQALNAAIEQLRKGRTADTQGAEDRYDALKKFARDLTAAAQGRQLVVVADPAVEPGGCVAEAAGRQVDAQVGPALARVAAVLR